MTPVRRRSGVLTVYARVVVRVHRRHAAMSYLAVGSTFTARVRGIRRTRAPADHTGHRPGVCRSAAREIHVTHPSLAQQSTTYMILVTPFFTRMPVHFTAPTWRRSATCVPPHGQPAPAISTTRGVLPGVQ